MSRSRKKAIVKDITYRKKDYWKIHRRVNKQIVKHWLDGARKVSPHYWYWDPDSELFKFKEFYLSQGYNEYEAFDKAYYETEDDWWFGRLSSNLMRGWWEEPELKNPKELINDYDYYYYKSKVEFYNNNRWLFWDETEDNLKNLKEQYRRK